MGQAVVPIYNLPTVPDLVQCSSSSSSVKVCHLQSWISLLTPLEQTLDANTLGAIFVGNVSWWNDSAIQDLNPSATLPQQQIKIGVTSSDPYSTISQVFARALAAENPNFASVFGGATSIVDWSLFVGIADRVTNTGIPGTGQTDFVKVRPLPTRDWSNSLQPVHFAEQPLQYKLLHQCIC